MSVKIISQEGFSDTFSEKIEVYNLFHQTLDEISIHQGDEIAADTIWFRYQTTSQTTFFLSMRDVCDVSEQYEEFFLNLSQYVPSATLEDFGLWKPPSHLSIWNISGVKRDSDSEKREVVHYSLVLTALSLENQRDYSDRYVQDLYRRSSVKCQMVIPCNEQGRPSLHTVLLRAPFSDKILSVRLTEQCQISHEITLIMEDAMQQHEITSTELGAEFIVGDITLAFEDYMKLQPGDAIQIDAAEIPLQGILQVAGLPIATGVVRVRDEVLEIQLNKKGE